MTPAADRAGVPHEDGAATLPRVTVVIPTHNRSALVVRTLRSALAQRDVDVCAVVVDDGSTDDTAGAVARLADPRVTVLRHATPQGVSAARNAGIAGATGDWVAFLDDDDLWAPDKLARQIAAADEAGAGWACTGSVTVTAEGRVVAGAAPPSGEQIAAELPRRNRVPAGASNVIARASVLAAAGTFDPRLMHIADWDLWIRLARLDAPAVVSDPLVAYCLHAGNASASTETLRAELDIVDRRYAALRGGRRIDRAYAYRWAAWHSLRAGRRGEALRAYARAALAGDVLSLGRAFVAAADRDVVARRSARHVPDPAWAARAAAWLARVDDARGDA